MLAPGASAVKILCSLLLLTSVASCADDASPDSTGEDLPLGDLPADMGKADGDWGAALTCKDVPNLPPLVSPKITVSLNGLTLHLTDAVTGFDKVFPIGPGRIETDPTSGEFGESLSNHPIATSGRHDFAITPASIGAAALVPPKRLSHAMVSRLALTSVFETSATRNPMASCNSRALSVPSAPRAT